MFENIELASPDPIFELLDRFHADPRSGKVNLTVGVFQNEAGETPILDTVKQAEQQLLNEQPTKSYLGMGGLDPFNKRLCELVLGSGHPAVIEQRAGAIQTPGGTGALRVVGEFIAAWMQRPQIWCSQPSWPNHIAIFEAAGLTVENYEYLNSTSTALDFDHVYEQIQALPDGSAVLFHACCHNPTGCDPSRRQWQELLSLAREKQLLPVFDFAYQGFHQSIDEDNWAIRCATDIGCTVLVCSSFSKNMGLYSERVGGLTVIAENADICARLLSQMKIFARAMYSNPPEHGAHVAALILNDEELCRRWIGELGEMRSRLQQMRHAFAQMLSDKISDRDFSFIDKQNGMFSYSGLKGDQADELLKDHAIYLLRSGRINVAGLNPANLERVVDAIADVLKKAPVRS